MRAARIVPVLLTVTAVSAVAFLVTRPSVLAPSPNGNSDTAEASTKILVVGDNHGDNPVYRRILGAAKTGGYDLFINLADTSENGTEAEFAAVGVLEAELPFPIVHVVGNHDIKADSTRGSFERAFNPRYLSREIGPAHIVILDNADRTVGFDDAELEWLSRDLASNKKAITLLFFHRPFGLPFASLTGDDETASSRRSNDRLLTILAEHSVTHVYAGHLHMYLPYSLALPVAGNANEARFIPVTISGGGGDPTQAALGGPGRSFFHALELTVTPDGVTERVLPAPTY
jgi:hypothetical protein